MDRVFVIGDIHGCARELETLLAGLPLGTGDTVACVGDYIDRGPESGRVLDLLLALRRRDDLRTVFLRGNHEDMCLAYIGRGGHWGEAWHLNGGIATLRSYGIDARLSGREVAARLPPAHVAFLESLRLHWSTDGHLLVHAGVRPGRSLAEQDEEDLLWIREEFIDATHSLPETVVFGHTPQRSVLVDLPYKIGIDTGCVYGGALTAVELREGAVYQVRFGDRQVRRASLPTGGRERRSSA
jgi:serine/threonine protein phosphatase 1